MKSRPLQTVIAAVLLVGSVIVFSADAALAQQTLTLKANIPFGFYAGEKLMPAGEYRVEPIAPSVVRLTHANSFATVSFFVLRAPDSKDPSPRLVFKAYGDERYLSELWWGQGRNGLINVPSPRERELAEASSKVRVSLTSAGR